MKNKNIEAVYSLSPMQQGMYFHSELANNSGVYVEQLNCLLVGKLEVEAFQKACQSIVDRHSILRTAFAVGNKGKLLQVVGRQVKIPFDILDFTQYSETVQKQKILDLQETEHSKGFILSKAPLMRIKLIKLNEQTHHFIWTHHHLLLDGWSVPIVLREVFLSYEAYRLNQPVDLPPAAPYRNYIKWLDEQDLEKAKTYWQRIFNGAGKATELPKLTAGTAAAAAGGTGEIRVRLSAAESGRIKAYAQAEKITVNTIMQGAWALVLGGYSGEEEVLFGATVSGRPAELEGAGEMVGLFINTLPVRVKLEMDEEVGEWLRRIQAQQTETREYEYSPLTEIRKWAGIKTQEKLFESILVFENYPVDEVGKQQTGSLNVQSISLKEQPNLPITIVSDLREIMVIRFKYDADIFSSDEINTYLNNLKNVLSQIINNQPLKLKEINLLTPEERQRITVRFNETAVEYPSTDLIPQAISRQARLTPLSPAVSFAAQTLTYRQLDEESNRLAHYLIEAGVCPEQCVGVLMERSIELIVSLLAVIKAGAAYVPLDPSYPLERLRYMARDARLRVLISQGGGHDKVIPVGEGDDERERETLRVIEWERERERIGERSALPAEVGIDPRMMAYMIYTSGSTGLPKGAVNTHEAIINRLQWMQETYRLGGGDKVLQKTPFSFDVSVWEIFLPLMTGAELVVAEPNGHQDSRYLVEVIRSRQITLTHFVPSMLRVFLEEEGVGECRSLRQIISSGEALSGQVQSEVFERMPWVELDNLYGPTEAAVDVTRWRCRRGDEAAHVPIGKAIANVRMYVLDKQLRVVPPGVVGDLYIAGVQVGRGYWNQAAMTAERFIPDLYSAGGGERMYQTGDLARYGGEEAVIEYIGRADGQVKVRGFRIELGEVEAALEGCAGVSRAAVRVFEDEAGEKQLTGYVVRQSGGAREENGNGQEGEKKKEDEKKNKEKKNEEKKNEEEVGIGQIRRELESRLPGYMIPAMIVEIEQMPVSANGKKDRSRLRRPERDELVGAEQAERGYRAAETPTQEKLVEIWEEVLKVKQIGITDNFFHLGGHSLIATQMVSRIRDAWSINLQLRTFFEATTIEQLSEIIDNEETFTSGENIDQNMSTELMSEDSDIETLLSELEELTLEETEQMLNEI